MTDWRRIDIDAYDPESGRLTAADLVPPTTGHVTLQDLQPRISQLQSYASSGDIRSAIQLITTDPPYGADEDTKAYYLRAVLGALSQVRQADILKIVQGLDPEQQNVLVKYLYKGMSVPEGQKQGAILLAWFEKLTQVSGIRPIMHYVCDRRTV